MKGDDGLSIGTSLAIDGLLGRHPDLKVSGVPLEKYKALWVNVSTLTRNIYNALDKEEKKRVVAADLADTLLAEMSIIDGLIKDKSQGRVTIVFYRNNLDNVKKYLPNANITVPNENKLITQTIMNNAMDETEELIDGLIYKTFDFTIKGFSNSVILTHNPIDLLSYYNFNGLTLLESHTGKLKPKSQWGTKLGPMAGENMPLNGFTIQVFGDGNEKIKMAGLKTRRAVVDIAKDSKWTSVTTLSRIRQTIRKVTDSKISEELNKYCTFKSFST